MKKKIIKHILTNFNVVYHISQKPVAERQLVVAYSLLQSVIVIIFKHKLVIWKQPFMIIRNDKSRKTVQFVNALFLHCP